MNVPRDLGPDFRSWLRDVPPMPPELPERTLDQTRRTRQRRRWLRFLPGRKPTAGADDREGRTRLTASNTSTRIGGISTMFSPTKLVAAAAVAALMGGMLVAGPFATQDSNKPAAPTVDDVAAGITLVSGDVAAQHQGYFGDTESRDWGYAVRDALSSAELAMSDERLSGEAIFRGHWNRLGDDSWTWVATESVYLENEGGSWTGTGHAYVDPASTGGSLGSGRHERLVLEGQDGYEGLTAFLDFDSEHADAPIKISGAIVTLGLPEMPGAAPTTLE